ncbi:hypothetical protein [Kerstersia gyiorum]|uniref:hypothetical protein n=1 Tax=Kerstersia gyiorum TaxID=206506 RepID=UPI00209E4149|nr:hypothetical protein [Kerstersia gyiorum]MCP1679418.1 hypothetical protein [Kerstersia gyiorum]MCP1823921.1 hypothetical protein [Kerstersia gyiorum]MCP1827362.1 hypothetical protein [Kerstersia gyiorum]MCW2448989.1 hypothetical protein [Kerstersia gyiorum]
MSTQTQDDITQPVDQTPESTTAPDAVNTPAQPEGQEPPAHGGTNPEGQPEGDGKPQRPQQHGVQKRVDEITRARREAEREAAYWKNIAQGSGKDSGAEQPAAQDKPTPDKFTSYDEYLEALTDWKADQRISKALAERQQAEQQRQQQEHRQQSAQTFSQRTEEFKAATPDFDDVLAAVADIEVSPEVQDLLMGSEHGPRIVYELAKDPAEARRIASLPPVLAAREIGRLEAKIAAPAAAPAQAAPPTVTKAPAPIQPNRSAAGQFTKDPAAMTDEEWWASQRKPK